MNETSSEFRAPGSEGLRNYSELGARDSEPRARWRGRASVALAVALLLLAAAPALHAAPAAQDARAFAETGYAIDDDAFWDYFSHRGGVQTFGYPVSRPFTLLGHQVQLFQRLPLERQDDGSVRPMSLLDSGLLPTGQINGSHFPPADPSLAMVAPAPDQPAYGARVQEFVQAVAPDLWNDQPVGFYSTFSGTVTCAGAFPNGGCQPDLLPLLDLEIWGMPTSQPAFDPANHNVVYQRFERGIMVYDADCRCTQGALLGDALKALLSGENLPDDLAAAAAGSPLLRQYAPGQPPSLARPDQLPTTDLTDAFTPDVQVASAASP